MNAETDEVAYFCHGMPGSEHDAQLIKTVDDSVRLIAPNLLVANSLDPMPDLLAEGACGAGKTALDHPACHDARSDQLSDRVRITRTTTTRILNHSSHTGRRPREGVEHGADFVATEQTINLIAVSTLPIHTQPTPS